MAQTPSPTLSLILTLSEDVKDLIRVLTVFQESGVSLKHIESRPAQSDPDAKYDYFLECGFPKLSPPTLEQAQQHQQKHDRLIAQLRELSSCVTITSSPNGGPENPEGGKEEPEIPWFPKCIAELDRCCTNLHKYGHELTPDHPGYGDTVYQERRKFIADVAYNYKYHGEWVHGCKIWVGGLGTSGDSIPRIQYTEEETKTWGAVFRNQTALYPTNACREYNEQFPKLFEACGYSLNDSCELMGHAPLFCDPTFAQFSQEIGLASLGLSDEWIEKMATLYWFTVEFGLCQEDGKPKAYGAGLLSGNEELKYCVTDKSQHKDFNISQALVQEYPETGLQPLYFVAQSLADMKRKMMEFAKTIPRPFGLKYDPYTQSVEVLDSYKSMEKCAQDIHYELGVLQDALKRQS